MNPKHSAAISAMTAFAVVPGTSLPIAGLQQFQPTRVCIGLDFSRGCMRLDSTVLGLQSAFAKGTIQGAQFTSPNSSQSSSSTAPSLKLEAAILQLLTQQHIASLTSLTENSQVVLARAFLPMPTQE